MLTIWRRGREYTDDRNTRKRDIFLNEVKKVLKEDDYEQRRNCKGDDNKT